MVYTCVELILMVLVVANECEIVRRSGFGWEGKMIQDSESRGIDSVHWDDIRWGKRRTRGTTRSWHSGRRIEQDGGCGAVEFGKVTLPLQNCRYSRGTNRPDDLFRPLVINEEERVILYNRAT